MVEDPVERLARPLIEREVVVGLAIGLLTPKGDRFVGLGKDRPDGSEPTPDTVFEIGSVTKVFTALALAQMVDAGEVTLDQPVASIIAGAPQTITLEALATHTAGLPRMPANFSPADMHDPYADYGADRLTAELANVTLTGAGHYASSNLGAGLLGHALATKAGVTYQELIVSRIGWALEMPDTFVVPTGEAFARMAEGHDAALQRTRAWRWDVLAGAGALRSTVNDMVHFVRAQLEPPEALAQAIALTHQARHPLDEGGGGQIGLGWHITAGGTRWHNGETEGFHSFIGFDPARRIGVVVLANTASAAAVDALGDALIDLLRGKSPPPIALPPRVPDATLDRYAGTYTLTPAMQFTIVRRGHVLVAQLTGQSEMPVFPESETIFAYQAVPAKLEFVIDATGTVTGLVLHQNGLQMAASRVR